MTATLTQTIIVIVVMLIIALLSGYGLRVGKSLIGRAICALIFIAAAVLLIGSIASLFA